MKILAAASPGEVRVAAWGPDGLADYALWRPGRPDGVGDVHRGRVTRKVPAMAGAFVALGDADGFLPDSEGAREAGEGSLLSVRITRAAQGGKGPRVSAKGLELPGPGPLGLLRRGPNAVERLAALHPGADLWVDDPALAAGLRALAPQIGPAFDDTVESAIAALHDSAVQLPGGAAMTLTPTPALVAIDVDLGAATGERRGKGGAQQAANRALLPALCRQLRLRNLSGGILVDLGGMPMRRRAALGPDFAEALAGDPLQPRFLGFTALGLAEILRPRVHPPLYELLAGPYAAGLAALRQAAAQVRLHPARALSLVAHPGIIDALQGDATALVDFTRRAGRPLTLVADRGQAAPAWRIVEQTPG